MLRSRAPMHSPPLAELVAAFRSWSLPQREWTAIAQLRGGAWHVHRCGAVAALAMLRSGIQRLNDQHGTPNSDTSGYHETITVAYLRLIEAFLSAFDAEV